jgi:RNA polymerase sigma-70 factor (ECF subfamily)
MMEAVASTPVGHYTRGYVRRVRVGERSGEISPSVLTAAQRGDAQAFAEIVRHYEYRMRVMAYRVVGRPEAMEDALQEAFLKAYRALPNFRGDAALGTWLCRIVYTTCITQLHKQRRELLSTDGEIPEPDEREPDTADVISARTDLAATLALLPPDQRVVVFLVDQEGLDYDTAGEILGIPAGTVGSRLSHARAALRAALEAADYTTSTRPAPGSERL